MKRGACGLRSLLLAAALALGACVSGPPVPDWQSNAKSALERALAAYLAGDTRAADADFERARSEVARTGRADLLARVELARCAARVASIDFDPCAGFDRLGPDAAAPERAYADYLAARVQPQEIALLPAQHRAIANPALRDEAAVAALKDIEDPLARLVAAGVLMRSGRANPAAVALAVDTSSAQGWRRPLLAWLNVRLALAQKAGDAGEAERLRRRIALILGDR